ncbi:hypothetical protein [Polaromonas sp.]|uniref:hypothetical protein n=1 Tax=Polaromonas sp. TaxID=1869339 RepID=UPI003BACF10E
MDDELVRIRRSRPENVKVTLMTSDKEIRPIGPIEFRTELETNYLTLSLSTRWDESLFTEFSGTDACLVVHSPEEFCERIHIAAALLLQDWSGLDAAVQYGGKSPLGVAYTKPDSFVNQQEYRFSWLPPVAKKELEPITVTIGNIERIAEIVLKPASTFT